MPRGRSFLPGASRQGYQHRNADFRRLNASAAKNEGCARATKQSRLKSALRRQGYGCVLFLLSPCFPLVAFAQTARFTQQSFTLLPVGAGSTGWRVMPFGNSRGCLKKLELVLVLLFDMFSYI